MTAPSGLLEFERRQVRDFLAYGDKGITYESRDGDLGNCVRCKSLSLAEKQVKQPWHGEQGGAEARSICLFSSPRSPLL